MDSLTAACNANSNHFLKPPTLDSHAGVVRKRSVTFADEKKPTTHKENFFHSLRRSPRNESIRRDAGGGGDDDEDPPNHETLSRPRSKSVAARPDSILRNDSSLFGKEACCDAHSAEFNEKARPRGMQMDKVIQRVSDNKCLRFLFPLKVLLFGGGGKHTKRGVSLFMCCACFYML